jgi:threonine synthase
LLQKHRQAATVALSGPPASIDSDDRAMYSQVLRATSGNVNAAMAAVAAQDKAGGES